MADTENAQPGTRRVTNLFVPDDLADEIDALAKTDVRQFRGEVIALLREAVAARKRRAA